MSADIDDVATSPRARCCSNSALAALWRVLFGFDVRIWAFVLFLLARFAIHFAWQLF